jgi:mRNA-degrading endonuclease RelE of RelBE toxin-antitoxin system
MVLMPNEHAPLFNRDVFFTPEFKRNLRQLARKYRRIKSDIEPIVTQLTHGETPGDRVPGLYDVIYKVRARNSDSAKGKRGGYRIIYQITVEKTVILITIYSKTEQADITADEIQKIITQHEQDHTVEDERTREDLNE